MGLWWYIEEDGLTGARGEVRLGRGLVGTLW